MTTFHVATTGSDTAPGTEQEPLRTINRAAALAMPGDTVTVHAGEYREWVRPRRGGRSDRQRITYQAAEGEHVAIKGSERVTGWTREEGTVWRAELPNSLFGDFNPYAEKLFGDWLARPQPTGPARHLGEVYLNGRSFYEVDDRASLVDPPVREEVLDDWTQLPVRVLDPDQTRFVWYAEVGAATTTIWANFHDADPNTELVEVNVRRSVFYPTEHHLDYITVRGFELAQAACPWTPPTADQPGLIGPNWAKGWIIEDNDIHDAKCSAVSLGKEASTGANYSAERGDKPGYQYQLESVFSARQIGWDAEHIGGHMVRRNTIHDCGQNAVVGHLGCVFSTIEDNHIYNIALKREFYGYEIAGIKLHAAIDVVIRRNRIHDCSLATWLDWQAQGTRYSANLNYDNSRDLFVEVSHGPYVVDHNLLLSPAAVEIFSQGGAYLNNLIAGLVRVEPVLDRATPYHRPHSTQVSGYGVIQGGDDRYLHNIFLGTDQPGYLENPSDKATTGFGTAVYDGHPAGTEAYREELRNRPPGDHIKYLSVRQPVFISGNVYAAGAAPFAGEDGAVVLEGAATARIVQDGDALVLELDLPDGFDAADAVPAGAADLPAVRLAGAGFDERDGSPLVLDRDLLGEPKDAATPYPAGPLVALRPGPNRIRLR